MSFGSLRLREFSLFFLIGVCLNTRSNLNVWPVLLFFFQNSQWNVLISNSIKGYYCPIVVKLRGEIWEVPFIYLPISVVENTAGWVRLVLGLIFLIFFVCFFFMYSIKKIKTLTEKIWKTHPLVSLMDSGYKNREKIQSQFHKISEKSKLE